MSTITQRRLDAVRSDASMKHETSYRVIVLKELLYRCYKQFAEFENEYGQPIKRIMQEIWEAIIQ